MDRDRWMALLESSQVREVVEYAEWLATYEQTSVTAALIKVLRAGQSRVEQLRKYAVKKRDPGATFRPYAPLKASDTTRIETKRRAAAEGISSESRALCGFQGLGGKRCWLPPHGPNVLHKF